MISKKILGILEMTILLEHRTELYNWMKDGITQKLGLIKNYFSSCTRSRVKKIITLLVLSCNEASREKQLYRCKSPYPAPSMLNGKAQ